MKDYVFKNGDLQDKLEKLEKDVAQLRNKKILNIKNETSEQGKLDKDADNFFKTHSQLTEL